jgi:hypothetical protein
LGSDRSLGAIGDGMGDRTVEWAVSRNNESIGRHRMVIRQENGDLVVDETIDLHVDFAFITMYRYRHHSREVWRNGALLRLTSQTDDDGSEYHVQAQSDPDGTLAVSGSAGGFVAPAGTLPSSLWQISMTEANRLLDLESGRLLSVHFSKKANELIDSEGRRIPAEHVAVAGDIVRDMWYDGEGLLIKQKFLAPDGSKIEYHLGPE